MATRIKPERLLSQARDLAGIGAGQGRPSPTDHRRAVSAAYYALFHEVCFQAARQLLPGDPDRIVFTGTRWLNHQEIKQVCEWVNKCRAVSGSHANKDVPQGVKADVWRLMSTQSSGAYRQAVPRDLARLTDAFPEVLDARHRADYDHLEGFSKQEAVNYVQQAADARECLMRGVDAEDPYVKRFLALAIAKGSRL